MNSDEALRRIPDLLSELTYLEVNEVQSLEHFVNAHSRPDLALLAGTLTFLIEYRSRSTAEAVASALLEIESWTGTKPPELRVVLLVVPYMGEVGRHLCKTAGVNWMDLSGNASIRAPWLNVNVMGLPNLYAARGRPRNIFAPKASRLARAFLTNPTRGWLNQELATTTHLSKGYVSKILARLESGGFVEKRDGRRYWPRDPENILDAWWSSYDFSAQRTLQGHVAARTPEEILRRLVESLGGLAIRTAVTGLAAAWHYAPHAAFRTCSLYASPFPEPGQLAELGFRPVESGANAWLIDPADESVFSGVVSSEGLPYVSPLQAYLDLRGHPERAEEASAVLRSRVLSGVA